MKKRNLIYRTVTALLAVGLVGVGLLGLAPTAQAAGAAGINQTINFQGRLLTATGAVVPDGTYNMEFQIWQDGNGCVTGCTSANAAANNGGTLKWTEDWIYGTGSPDNRVTIKNGYFSVALGSLTAFGGSVNWNWDTLYLTTNVGNTSSAASFAAASPDGYMIPFKRLAANPYSLNSAALGGLTSSQYVQLGQGIQGGATTGSTALIGLNQTSTGNILDLQKGGADVLLVDSTGSTLFRPNSDSTTALQVQKAGTTTKVFTVDTSNSRIGIGNISPAYAVDAVGSVNASTSLKVAGTDVCTTSGCTASAASAILNQTTLQASSNFYISGTGIANTALLAPVLGTADQSAAATSSTALTVYSGNATGTGASASGNVNITSGNSTNSNSGNVSIDVGTAGGTKGTISVGGTNAPSVLIGTGNTAQTSGPSNNIYVGSTNTSSIGLMASTSIAMGTPNALALLSTGGFAVATPTNSVGALYVQNAASENVLAISTVNTTNLATNAGFEVNTTGWTATGTGASIARQTTATNVYSGIGSLAVTLGSSGATGAQITSTGLSGSSLAAGTYTLSFYAKGGAAISGLAASFSGGGTCTLNATTVVTGGFQRYFCTVTTGGSTTSVNITATTTSQTLYLDGVQIQTGSTATAYGTGSATISGLVTSPLVVQNNANSTSAFQVQSAGGTSTVLGVDTLNKFVGIGTATPSAPLHVSASTTATTSGTLLVQQTSTGDASLQFQNPSSSFFAGQDTSDGSKFKITSALANAAAGAVQVGNTTWGGSFDSGNNNEITATKISNTTTGTVSAITVYIGSVTAAPSNHMQVALYADTAGTPSTLIASSASQALVPNSWNTFAVSASVTASTSYWLAFNVDGVTTQYGVTTGLNSSYQTTVTYGTWPGTFSQSFTSGTYYSMYMSVSAAASDQFAASLFSLSQSGQATFQNSSDSPTALRVQNAAGTALLNVDTSNGRLSVGANGTATGQVYVSGNLPTAATGTFCNTCTYGPMKVQGKYAYLQLTNGSLTILDVSNPASITSVSNTSTGLSAAGEIVVVGRYAYLTGGSGGSFTVMDISNPTAPTIVSTLGSAGNYYSLALQGRYAYMLGGASNNTMRIVDVANPANPVIVSTVTTGTKPTDISIQGRYAYVVNSNTSGTSFQAFDIADPSKPTAIGSIATGTSGSGLYNVNSFTANGRYGYAGNGGTTGGYVIDLANPASPAVVGSGFTNTGSVHPVMQGRYMYFGDYNNARVQVYDISTPTVPSLVGNFAVTGNLAEVIVQGRYLYTTGYFVNPSFGIYDLGGTYSQQLEAGGASLGSLSVDGDAIIGGNIRMQGSIGTAGVNAGTVATGSLSVASLSNDSLTGTVIGNTQVDPTGVQPGWSSGSGAQMSANQFTTGPTTSTVSYLNVFVGNVDNSPNNHFQMAIYTDSSNAPTTKVVDSASVVLKPNSWNSVAISTTTLSANTKYWIAYNTDTTSGYFNNPAMAYNSTAATAFIGRTYASGYPASFGCPCSTWQTLTMFASSTLPQPNLAAQVQNSSGISALAVNAGAQTVGIAQIIAPSGVHIARSANTPTVANIGTAGSTSYSYAIAAIDDRGVIGQASPVQTTATGNATLNGTNYNRVTLPAVGSSVVSYNVYRTANGASATAIGLIGNTSSTTFNDQGATVLSKAIPSTTNSLSASTTYYYQVTAIDSGSGESAPSTETSLATGATGRAITLSWFPQRGARGYKIYRSTASGSEVYLATTTEPYFTDDGSVTISALAVPTTGTAFANQLGGISGAQLSVGTGQAVGEVYVGLNMPVAPVSATATGSSPDAMAIQGRYVYVGNYGDSTIGVYDASISAKPVLLNTITTNGSSKPNFFTIAGKYLYVAGDSGVLQIYDISNPLAITSISSTATGTTPEVVQVQGRYAYVLNSGGATIQTYDVSNPGAPVSQGTVATGTLPQAMTVSGRYLYVTNYTSGTMGIYDLVNPASPALLSTTNTAVHPYTVTVQGRYAYVIGSSLQVFDVSTPTTPYLVSTPITSLGGPVSIVVQGRFAFTTGTSAGMEAFDISNPMNLVSIGVTPMKAAGSTGALVLQGRYLYSVGGGAPGYLNIVDLGGTYSQTLEGGTAELGALTVRSSANIGDALNVAGGLSVGSNAQVYGALGVAGNANFQTQTNSTGAFSVQNSAGNTLLGVDTSGSNVNVGSTGSSTAASNVHIADTSSGTGVQAVTIGNTNNTGNTVSIQGGTGATGIQIGAGNTAHGIQIGAGGTSTAQAIIIGSTGSSSSIAINSGTGNTALTTLGNTTINGISATVKSTTNNQNAFQIQNSAGTNQINVNTLTTDNNLWPNPSFEQSINGVVAHGTGAVVTQNGVDVAAQFGVSVLKFTTSGTANAGAEFRYGFKGSTQYNISVWLRTDSGSFSTISLGRADNGTDTDCLSGATVTTTWTQFTCTSAFTTGTTIGNTSNFYVRNTGASSKTVYVDGVTLVAGATALPYALPGSAMQVEPYANQVTFNAGNNGEIQPWQINANPLTLTRSRPAVTSANGFVYVMGGGTGGDGLTPSSTVYIAKANADGSLGTWSNNNSVALGTAVSGAGATVVNGYIYVIGGSTGAVGSSDSALVQYARLNSDGSTGTWSTTTALPAVRDAPGVTSANGAIQVMGGNTTSTTIATSLYAKVNQDGTISSWTSTSTMASAEENIQPVVSNGYVYVVGGSYSNATAADNIYQYAPINSDGSIGTWVNGGVMGVTRGDTGVVALNGRIYMMGGWDGTSNVMSTVYSALIMSDGSLGPVVQSANPLPIVSATSSQAGVENARAALVNGYIYMIGGDVGSGAGTAVSKVYYTSGPRLKVLGSLDLTSGNGTLTNPGSGGQLTAGNTLVTGTLQVADAANFVRSVNVMGQLTVGGNVEFRTSTNSTTAFQVQNATGSALINFDTSGGIITIGNSGNTVTFASTGEPTLAGTARHAKTLTISPEYPGAVLDVASDTGGSINCNTNNAGTMTSGFVATGRQNYYNWTSASGSGQCYDIVVQVQLPSDWAAWNGASSLMVYNSVGTDSTSIMADVIDTTGTNDTAYSATAYNGVSSGTTFASTNLTAYTGTYAADGYMTFKFRVTSSSNKNVRIGNLTLNYLSKF